MHTIIILFSVVTYSILLLVIHFHFVWSGASSFSLITITFLPNSTKHLFIYVSTGIGSILKQHE